MSSIKKIVCLSSGLGTTVAAFCEEFERASEFQIQSIITDKKEAPVSLVAKKYNIPFEYIQADGEDFDKSLLKILKSLQPDLVLLMGFLKKIGPLTLDHFKNRILNSHPSLLPDFGGEGFFGLKVHQAVINSGQKQTGVTIHIVNEEYDKGPILNQKTVDILPGEQAEQLQERLKKIEKSLYIDTVKQVLKGVVRF